MGKLVNYITSIHKSTKRSYFERMANEKVACMLVARKFDKNYWDGERKYGYGGYKYIPGLWKPMAEKLIKNYNLTNESSVLDVGCGKAFLLYELKLILPELRVSGFDVSEYGISHADDKIKKNLFIHKAQDIFPFKDNEFDFVMSTNCLHNLQIFDLKLAVQEIERVGKKAYIALEGYRNEEELFNLQCWALTCESFFSTEEWSWLFKNFDYNGDYEFIFFE